MNALTNLLIPRILGNDGTQNVLAQQAIILAGIVSDDLSPVAVQNSCLLSTSYAADDHPCVALGCL